MYTVFACETVTGKNLGPLDCQVSSWGRVLNGIDTVTVTVSPGALTPTTRDRYRLLTEPARMTLVLDWDGIAIAACPIWTRGFDGQTLTLNASGIRSILTRRKAIPWSTPYVNQSLTYSNQSLGSIAARLVQVATSTSKPNASLPIILPSFETDTDATHQRTYFGFDLGNVGDLLDALTGVLNGPDIDFLPMWADGQQSAITWQMRVGTDEQPTLGVAQPFAFDATQPQSSVQTLTITEDSSQLATAQWGKGSGSDVDTLIGFSSSTALTSAGWPLLEQETDYTTVTDQMTLNQSVAGDLQTNSTPLEQWGMTVDITRPPWFGTYQLGDPITVGVRNHIWLPDSPATGYPMRIVGLTGDSSTTVTIQIQEQ